MGILPALLEIHVMPYFRAICCIFFNLKKKYLALKIDAVILKCVESLTKIGSRPFNMTLLSSDVYRSL